MKRYILALLATAGCGELGDPEQPVLPGQESTPPANEPTVEPEPREPPAAPTVDAVPARYGFDTLPLRGSVAPFGVVLVEGGAGAIAGDADASGRFCLEVPLRPGRQSLMVSAQDDLGRVSSPTRVEVEQDSSLAVPVEPVRPLADRALGVSAASSAEPLEGRLSALTDGDGTSFVLMPTSVVWLDLGATFEVESIELWSPDRADGEEGTFPLFYDVLASAQAAPELPPDPDEAGWMLVESVTDESSGLGDGGVDELMLVTPLRARFVAVALWENDAYEWPFSPERMRVSELRVHARAPSIGPVPPTAPTCGGPAPQ